jgi:D-3-phosphoglycerate dehydrogenase
VVGLPSSPRPIILNIEPADYSPQARAILQSAGELREKALSRAALLRDLADVDVLITRLAHRIDEPVFAAAPRLRVLVTATTGLDHIDLTAARRRGVQVLSLKGETRFLRTIAATAEHTWGLLLALLRHIPAASADVRAGRWNRDAFIGNELRGKRLGIVGVGRIGEKIARYGLAFGMKVSGYDPLRRRLPRGVTRCPSLDALLRRSDILTLHVPLEPGTTAMIDAAAFARLPPGAVLINTARGAVVDEAALLAALQSGRLAGAGLDVVCDEQGIEAGRLHPLLRAARHHPSLLITPHIGGCTVESRARTEVFMARKLMRALQRPQP